MEKEITIALTSCGRFDLLRKTVESLIENWQYEKPKEWIIYEDSIFPQEQRPLLMDICGIADKFCPTRLLGTHEHPVGQIKACDVLFSAVRTPYCFWTEDDIFFHTPGFIQESLDILENDPKVIVPWIRDKKDMNKHPVIPHVLKTPNGTRYQKLVTNYRKVWAGFSFYAGLRRKSDYDLIGSYSKFMGKNSLETESKISMEYKRLGFYAVTLLSLHCSHLGQNRSLPK